MRIKCDECLGTGWITVGGADILSDPPDCEPCEECGGKGYIETDA